MVEAIILGIIAEIILIVTLIRQAKHIKEQTARNKELRDLNLQEVHNNTIIVEEDRKIRSILIAIENLVDGKREDKEVRAKIKGLLSDR